MSASRKDRSTLPLSRISDYLLRSIAPDFHAKDLSFDPLLHNGEDHRKHHQHRVERAKFEHRGISHFLNIVSDLALDRLTLAPKSVFGCQSIENRIAGSPAERSIDDRIGSVEDSPARRSHLLTGVSGSRGCDTLTAAGGVAFTIATESSACTIAA